MPNRPAHCVTIEFHRNLHWIIATFLQTLRKKYTRKYRRDQYGKRQCAEKSEGNGPRHRSEQSAFNALQRENWQVGGDDDCDGIKHGPLYFVAGFADHLRNRPWRPAFIAMTKVTNDVFDHHYRTIHYHPEIQRSQG